MAAGKGGRRSTRNRHWAEKIGGLMEPDPGLKEWWTDRQAMNEAGAKRADNANKPCHLYLDFGEKDLIVITVQRIPREVE